MKNELGKLILAEKSVIFNGGVFAIAPGEPVPPMTYFKFNKRQVSNVFGWLIKVDCPYCGKQHLHGWLPPDQSERLVLTRQAHCHNGSYYIQTQGGNNG